jgi:hypothetical protein
VALVPAPLELAADDPTYPVSRSLLEPRVLLALAGWIGVVLLALAAARRAPAVTFLVLAFFLWLAPHSSIVPLAEPVNEHRPYLALTGLVLLASVAVVAAAWRAARRPRVLVAALVLLLLVPLVLLTRARNRDWRDAETLWADTARKAPASRRAAPRSTRPPSRGSGRRSRPPCRRRGDARPGVAPGQAGLRPGVVGETPLARGSGASGTAGRAIGTGMRPA